MGGLADDNRLRDRRRVAPRRVVGAADVAVEFPQLGDDHPQDRSGVIHQVLTARGRHTQAAAAVMRASIFSFSTCGVKGFTM